MGDVSLRDKFDHLAITAMRRAHYWGRRRLPPGIRTLAGIAFVIGGLFGWLPILGFWMIPVGLLLIVLDIPPWRRPAIEWLRQKKMARSDRLHQAAKDEAKRAADGG